MRITAAGLVEKWPAIRFAVNQRYVEQTHQRDMLAKGFQYLADPNLPQHLLYTREGYEIAEWIKRRERDCWLRLFAFQVIFGSLVWSVLFR